MRASLQGKARCLKGALLNGCSLVRLWFNLNVTAREYKNVCLKRRRLRGESKLRLKSLTSRAHIFYWKSIPSRRPGKLNSSYKRSQVKQGNSASVTRQKE